MRSDESCPECGSEEFDEAEPGDAPAPDNRRDIVVYICRDCGTAWDAESPRR